MDQASTSATDALTISHFISYQMLLKLDTRHKLPLSCMFIGTYTSALNYWLLITGFADSFPSTQCELAPLTFLIYYTKVNKVIFSLSGALHIAQSSEVLPTSQSECLIAKLTNNHNLSTHSHIIIDIIRKEN